MSTRSAGPQHEGQVALAAGDTVTVLFDYEATDRFGLTVFADQVVTVVASLDGGWSLVQLPDSREGYVPTNYLSGPHPATVSPLVHGGTPPPALPARGELPSSSRTELSLSSMVPLEVVEDDGSSSSGPRGTWSNVATAGGRWTGSGSGSGAVAKPRSEYKGESTRAFGIGVVGSGSGSGSGGGGSSSSSSKEDVGPRQRTRLLLLAGLAAALVALTIGLAVGLTARGGGGLSPAEQLALSHDVVNAAFSKLVPEGATTVELSAATVAELDEKLSADLPNLLYSLGVGAGRLVLDLLPAERVLRPAEWLVGFPNRAELCPTAAAEQVANGTYEAPPTAAASLAEVDGLPVRVLRGNGTVLDQRVAVLVALFVEEVSSDPRVELAVRVTLDSGDLLAALPALGLQPTWLEGASLAAGASVVVCTADFVTPTFELHRGVNLRGRLEASPPSAQFYSDFVSWVQTSGPTTLTLTGWVPFDLFAGGRVRAPRTGAPDAQFDLRLENAALRLPAGVSVSVDQLSLRATGLGRAVDARQVPALDVLARATVTEGSNRLVLGAGGSWDPDSGVMQWGACSREIVLPQLSDFFVVDSVRGSVRFVVDSGNTRLDYADLEGVGTLPPLGPQQARLFAYVSGGRSPQFGLLLQAPTEGVAGVRRGLCKFAGYCNVSMGPLDDLPLNDVVLRVAAATQDTVIRGVPVRAGVTAWGEAGGLALPGSLGTAASLVGVDPSGGVVSAGFTVPLPNPSELSAFLSFGGRAVQVENGTGSSNSSSPPPAPSDMFDLLDVRAEIRPLDLVPSLRLSATGQMHGLADGPLDFTVAGSLTAGLSVVLEGYMTGEWNDVAGVPGLYIADAGVSLGVAPGPLITEVGMWGTFAFGPSASANFTVLLSAARGKFAVDASLRDLSARNLVEFAEQVSGVSLPGAVGGALDALLGVRINSLQLTIAPLPVDIGGRHVEAGFRAVGDGTLMGASFALDIGKFDRNLQVLPGVYRNMSDFRIGFNLTGLTLSQLTPAFRLGTYVADQVRQLINDNKRLCCCGVTSFGVTITPETCLDIPVGNIDSVVSTITGGVDGLLSLSEFTLEPFNVSGLVLGVDPDPLLTARGTALGVSLSGSVRVPVSWFGNTASTMASTVWGAFAAQTSGLVTSLAKAAMNRYCSTISNLLKVDIGVTTVTISIPGVC